MSSCLALLLSQFLRLLVLLSARFVLSLTTAVSKNRHTPGQQSTAQGGSLCPSHKVLNCNAQAQLMRQAQLDKQNAIL